MAELKRKTLEEIEHDLTVMAESETGAPRLGALKALAAMKSADLTLSPVMTDDELVLRLGRLMRGAGRELTTRAYAYAFPGQGGFNRKSLNQAYKDASPEIRLKAKEIMSLKMLYREFPEMKRTGSPPGYPKGKSDAMKIAWCQEQALKCLVEREFIDQQQAHESLTEEPTDGGRPAPDDEVREPIVQ